MPGFRFEAVKVGAQHILIAANRAVHDIELIGADETGKGGAGRKAEREGLPQ